ncbi:uncharacterized protein METZ01_LOCUS414426, partial [marine metagenome]
GSIKMTMGIIFHIAEIELKNSNLAGAHIKHLN